MRGRALGDQTLSDQRPPTSPGPSPHAALMLSSNPGTADTSGRMALGCGEEMTSLADAPFLVSGTAVLPADGHRSLSLLSFPLFSNQPVSTLEKIISMYFLEPRKASV